MNKNLNKKTVLQLNKAWTACDVKSPAEAISMVFSGAAKILDTETMMPMSWKEWLALPVREEDEVVHSPNLTIRVPRIIIAINYSKVHCRKIQCNLTNLRKVYKGRCAITGEEIKPSQGSKEHVIPRSHGGKSDWGNLIYASKKINNQRGSMSYKDAGLPEPKILPSPTGLPASMLIINEHKIPEWDMFLKEGLIAP